jgi:alkyl hydroperoxide reductase subunit F
MAEVEKIFGDEFVKGLSYRDRRSGKAKKIFLQGIFVAAGHQPNSEIFKNLVKLTKAGEIIVNPKTQETSCKGIWASGDVTDGLYRQNNIAVGDAIKAVLNIYQSMLK